MENEPKIKKEFENITELVADMYDLMDSYKGFGVINGVDDFPRMAVIKKAEKRIEEAYPKFEDIRKVEAIYSRLCSAAKTFYENEPAKEVLKIGFKGFTIPKPFQDYLHQKK